MNDLEGRCLNLLLFSVGDAHFGIDAEQAQGTAVYCGEAADDLFWFHEELGFGKEPPVYRSPTIVTIKIGGLRPYRVIIDSMEDIAEFSLNDIQPFPPLVERFVLQKGMWGVLNLKGRMILLVDLQRLLKGKNFENTDMEDTKFK
jgi:chemotaxis signal transduction protein